MKKELTLKLFKGADDIYDIYDEKKEHIGVLMFNHETKKWWMRRQVDNVIMYQ